MRLPRDDRRHSAQPAAIDTEIQRYAVDIVTGVDGVVGGGFACQLPKKHLAYIAAVHTTDSSIFS